MIDYIPFRFDRCLKAHCSMSTPFEFKTNFETVSFSSFLVGYSSGQCQTCNEQEENAAKRLRK